MSTVFSEECLVVDLAEVRAGRLVNVLINESLDRLVLPLNYFVR